jgi:hypothetical protein
VQRLDHAQRAERVGHHDADEVVGGHVGDRLAVVVLDPGVDQQQIERRTVEPRTEIPDLIRVRDVDRLDVELARPAFEQRVQFRPRARSNRADDVPATREIRLGDREA